MANLRVTSFLLPFNRCLVLPFFASQRYNYNMTLVSNPQCKKIPNNTMMLKRNAISWPNPIEKLKTKNTLKLGGSLLYENIADKINYDKFYQDFQMEDTFFSWFLITELHVWMMALRIMQEEEHGRELRNYLIEAMWDDVKIRSKKLGFTNASLMNQQLKLLSEQFNASLVGYDEAIMSNDRLLANHVWKRFLKNEINNATQLEQLVRYVRKQVNLLSKTPSTDIFSLSPNILWVNI